MNLSELLVISVVGRTALFMSIGVAIGGVHFATLRRNVHLFVSGGPAWRAICLQTLRMAITASALFACALAGTLPLLAALGGLLLGRGCVLRKAGAA